MFLEEEIKTYVRLVARDMKAGTASAHIAETREFMTAFPDAVLNVIDIIQIENGRGKPDETMIEACIHMFGVGLEEIRFGIEHGEIWAEEILDGVRDSLFSLAEGGLIPPHLLMLLLNTMIEARLPPGDELTDLLGDMALETVDEIPDDGYPDIGGLFESIVEGTGDNEFEVHEALADISKALPPDFRMVMLDYVMTADNPVLRDTAVLYLLDPVSEVRRKACQLIADHASPSSVSPVALRRMIALRNWLPEDERSELDAGIRKCRQQQVECAAWPKRLIEEIVATNMDGAGAQSAFVVTRRGNKHLIASLLVKQEVGIADAWCLGGQSKGDVRKMLGRIHSETDAHRVKLDFLHYLVPHYLAVGRKDGAVPLAGMLEFVEAIGIEAWQPSELDADGLISLIEQDIDPARLDSATIARVTGNSGRWIAELPFLDTWFEQDAEVDAILADGSNAGAKAMVDAIIDRVLEPRRAKWTERFLCTALWLKQKRDSSSPWIEFFIVGRELHRNRPIGDIPIMRGIAEATVDVRKMRF